MNFDDLIRENERLKEENQNLRIAQEKRTRRSYLFLGRITSLIIGKKLKISTRNLVYQLRKGETTNEVIADFVEAVIRRLTRVGIIGLMIAILPSMFLLIQSNLLFNQNRLFKEQNERLVQQTYLQEAQRRSSLNFLLGNIFDKIDEELKNNENRDLSDQLLGRIIALTHSLKPYYFLEGDKLVVRPWSPERGQLMIALLNSKLDSNSYNEIFGLGNFSQSDLKETELSGINFRNFSLYDSRLDGISIQVSTINHSVGDLFIVDGFIHDCTFNINSHNSTFSIKKSTVLKTRIEKKSSLNLHKLDLSQSYLDSSFVKATNLDTLSLKGSRVNVESIIQLDSIYNDSGKPIYLELEGLNVDIDSNNKNNFVEQFKRNEERFVIDGNILLDTIYSKETENILWVRFKKL